MASFDPTTAVRFDLDRGQVSLAGGGPQLLVPADALAQVCSSLEAGTARHFGEVLGKQCGERVRQRLGAATIATLEDMVEQVGGELALGGLGSLSIERWGQALVVRIEGCPLAGQAHELMSAYVETAIRACTGREPTALPLERGHQSFRLLLCHEAVAGRVKAWLSAGRTWGDALAALHHDAGNDVEEL
jgi:hypothetical protein